MTPPHPMHIDIPPNPPSRAPGDLPESLEARILGESDMPIDLDGNHDHDHAEAVDLEPTTPSAARPPPAKGILKNGLRRPSQIGEGDQPATEAERVQWDEKNLVDTEAEKNSTMKITEPKTPYVWGNGDRDDAMSDVPDFDLQQSPGQSSDRRPSLASTRSSSSSRSASFSLPTKSGPVRPGGGSFSSSRSRTPSDPAPTQTQAHLVTPNPAGPAGDASDGKTAALPSGHGTEVTGMALGATSANTAANAQRPAQDGEEPGGDVFSDSDEEMTEEQKAEREQFKEKRKEHYAMEAKLALKRARELMDQDEAAEGVEDEEEGDGGMEVDEVDGGFLNGQGK